MDYDDIVIGSGLTALATVLGLPAERRILVVAGPAVPRTLYYDSTSPVPCAHLGPGGLGNFWHGVIPTGGHVNFAGSRAEDFSKLFGMFYPGVDVASRLGRPLLFVPWKPIRPAQWWARLGRERGGRLKLIQQPAERFEMGAGAVAVHIAGGVQRAARVWICSGTLQTAGLLDRSLERKAARATVSDHVLIYLGQIDRARHPDVAPTWVERTRQGGWFQTGYTVDDSALITRRPARFGYRQLDWGIEQRAVFGLPTGGAVAKIVRAASPGLIAEALYNRLGLFPSARIQSVYAMLAVPDAHWLREDGNAVVMRQDIIRANTDAVRAAYVPDNLIPSRRPEIFLPVIHLHHSVERQALEDSGIGTAQSPVQVMDASVQPVIGPEHHSFKLMVAAFTQAARSR